MPLTDYISPIVLAEAGYIHESQSAEMLKHIDRDFLTAEGWTNLKYLGNVEVNKMLAADIMGVSKPTLMKYIKLGYIRPTAEGKINLLAVINLRAENIEENLTLTKRWRQG